MNKVVLPKLSYNLMGILVHNELGPLLLEKYYQRAVEEELKLSKLDYKKEVPVELWYKSKSIGRYLLDFIIEDLIILEIKAQQHYSPKFFKQALSYLQQTNLPLAIICNFRLSRLSYKRIINLIFKEIGLSSKDEKFG